MKYIIYFIILLPLLSLQACYDDGELKEDIENLNNLHQTLANRLSALESQVQQINTNISSIQVTVAALKRNVYVSNVKTTSNGYKLHFTDNTMIELSHGKDGMDGTNGRDGEDGANGENGKDGINAPVIGVALYKNVYYWTITTNGETAWLLGNKNEKLRVVGEDGKDGANGADGSDGINGRNGVTPLLKIDAEGYWMVSTDGGNTYKRVLDGNRQPLFALGEEGEDGQDGTNGTNGTNGEDGEKGTDGQVPVIDVKLHSDSIYYWTKDGAWLTDEYGNKLKANGVDGKNGQPVIAPALKIENGRWLLSTDGGDTWNDIGQATGNRGQDGKNGANGDAFFQTVVQNDEVVTIILTNGTTLQVPRYKKLTISFRVTGDVVIAPGGSCTVHYTLTGASEKTIVKAVAPNGWSAKVTPTSSTSGSIAIHAPSPMTANEIVVLVYNGESTMIVSTLYCRQDIVENNKPSDFEYGGNF